MVILVTGAGSGIGRASALAIAEAGARLVLVDINRDAVEQTAERIDGRRRIHTVVADMTSTNDVERMVAEAVDTFGSLDGAHNNAGIVGPIGPMVDVPEDQLQRLFDVNVFGVWRCMQAEIRQMLRQGGGAIVNTASTASVTPTETVSAYVTAKHAVLGMTRCAALEYGGRGIRVNAVSPGHIETNMSDNSLDEEMTRAVVSRHPIGRIGQPEDISDMIVWLLSDRSSFVLGSNIFIDGGFSMH